MERTLDLKREEEMRNHVKIQRSGLHQMEISCREYRLQRNVERRNQVKTESSELHEMEGR